MSLINKIFLAFVVMVAIAVVAAVVGWNAVSDIDETTDRIIAYEITASDRLGELEASFANAAVAQRTLMSSSLLPDVRAEQHSNVLSANTQTLDLAGRITALLDDGASKVDGWPALRAAWGDFQPQIAAWDKATKDGEAMLAAWENTTILNPDALLKNIMQYRGDHFQLAARLGEMISVERNIGDDINPADNVCAFGRWRTRFENGEEVFSRNPELVKAMNLMTEPHREFHQSAADVQKLIKDGFEKNRDAIVERFGQHLAAARGVIETFGLIMAEAEHARELFARAESFTMGELRQARRQSLDGLTALLGQNHENTGANFRSAEEAGLKAVHLMRVLAIAALALGFLIIVYLFWTIRRQLTRPLTNVIAHLGSDAQEVSVEANGVASSSSSLSEGASSQSAALEETSAAIEEITAMARRNLDNAQQANREMQTNATQIDESTRAVERMSAAMGEIKDSSEKIGNILKTIEDIAFQTNLLALNAAVEAARAGEAGKGFAVVADEVRNLAQRSAQAVKDTSELITGTVDRVGNGVRITGEIESHFEKIAGSTDRITRMISEIDVATGEQTQGLEQINQSVSQIDHVNQQNASHADSNAKASETLNARSNDLMEQIGNLGGVLRIIVGGRGATAGTTPVKPQPKAAKKPRNGGMKALPPPKK